MLDEQVVTWQGCKMHPDRISISGGCFFLIACEAFAQFVMGTTAWPRLHALGWVLHTCLNMLLVGLVLLVMGVERAVGATICWKTKAMVILDHYGLRTHCESPLMPYIFSGYIF